MLTARTSYSTKKKVRSICTQCCYFASHPKDQIEGWPTFNRHLHIYGLFIGHSCNEQKYSWVVWGEKDHMWDERKLWPFFLPFLLAKTKSFLSRHEQKKTCFSPARSPIYWASSAYIIHVCHFAFYLFFVWWCSFKKSQTQCLKITQNVAFEFLNFGISHQFLSYWNWLVW